MTQTIETSTLTFRLGKSSRWLIYLVGIFPLGGLLAWAVCVPSQFTDHLPYALLGGGGCAIFAWLTFGLAKRRIEIDSAEIRQVGPFNTKALLIESIEGFKIVQSKYTRILTLVTKDSHVKKMRIELALERQAEFLDWMERNLTNLDKVEYDRELMEIAQLSNFGDTPEERAAAYQQAKKWSRIINGASTACVLWAFFVPRPYEAAILSLLILPIIGLLFLNRFDGIAKFNAKPKSAHPGVDVAILLPTIMLSLRALIDWHVLEWRNFWTLFAAVSIGHLIISGLLVPDIRKALGKLFLCAIFSAAYGYGTVIVLNGMLADSPWNTCHAKVIGKHMTTGKNTTYYLTLAPWKDKVGEGGAGDATVSSSVYNQYETGNTASIMVRSGKFGIPYYFVH